MPAKLNRFSSSLNY